ncbi:hypothetical protein BJV78DRAFT_1286921 [Lactifluus subvellereus]|nr:hypothetical protein BJV78DRAFT_1286921 [Lactifluus subvellereus]
MPNLTYLSIGAEYRAYSFPGPSQGEGNTQTLCRLCQRAALASSVNHVAHIDFWKPKGGEDTCQGVQLSSFTWKTVQSIERSSGGRQQVNNTSIKPRPPRQSLLQVRDPLHSRIFRSPHPQRPVTTVKALRGVRVDPEERQWYATVVHGRGVLEPYRHPRTHGVPAAFIQFRAHHPEPIQLAAHFASHVAASLGIPISGVVSLPTRRTLWTENFERRVHARAFKAFDADAEIVDRWVRYLEAHALPGVGMRVVRWHRLPIGIGHSHLQSVVGRMHLGKATNRQKMKELGDEIVEVESQAAKRSA